ncbi:Methyltransferase domain-containing protein [Treponema bryantii]|uniref:Methyltransferase domain-containing protein n=1 Tax=Treponema bryantii TaxID=163 RepID=A0A1H9AVX6_9SPIR|nr:methyltransferase domain-containing protein [Treponema bryantii]SEP80769.1 Methyltransferase domain-containing protein [Treponema bryantii]
MKADYDEIADNYDNFFSSAKYREEDYEVAKKVPANGKVLDIGCGTGLLIDLYKYKKVPEFAYDYNGVDPCFKMLKKLILKYGDKKCQCCKFEEMDMSEKYDTIVSLYNSPSYIKPRAITKIKNIANNGAEVFLMFAKDGYTPIAHSLGHNKIKIYGFSAYKKYLRKLSKNFSYEEFNNYVIVSGKL